MPARWVAAHGGCAGRTAAVLHLARTSGWSLSAHKNTAGVRWHERLPMHNSAEPGSAPSCQGVWPSSAANCAACWLPVQAPEVGPCATLGASETLALPGWGVEAVLKNTEYRWVGT
jgi:hypothetical protein